MTSATAAGLEGVVVANTVLSEVDGERGRLVVRGAAIEDLAGQIGFEELLERLWAGLAPAVPELPRGLGAARVTAHELLTPLYAEAAERAPLDALRLLLAALSDGDHAQPHLLVTAAVPVALAAVLRVRAGEPPVAPDPSASHAADFMRMATGRAPDPSLVAALEAYLVTVAEHGMNASTFTARVIASTHAGVVASVVGALCALSGPLHGGAPGPVLDMLDDIGTEERIKPWLAAAGERKDRLMGFGHRIYRVRDPRADVLKGVVSRLPRAAGDRLAFATIVEREALAYLAAAKPERRLDTNVEFYTALVLEAIGIPRDAFTAVFALGRVGGWTAHVYEQLAEGRLMRPQSRYVGPPEA